MKKVILSWLVFSSIIICQPVKFVSLSDIEVSQENFETVKTVLDSIDNQPDIDFVVISGNLTENQDKKEFQLLDQEISKMNKPVYILPGMSETFKLGDSWLDNLPGISDNKFAFEKNGYVFIGLTPTIPFLKIYHFTNDDFSWLDKQLSSSYAGKEKFIFFPADIKNYCLNWNEFISKIERKNVKLLSFGESAKTGLFSEDGFRAYQVKSGLELNKKKIGYNVIGVTKDSVIFYERELGQNEKFVDTFDKNIQINTNRIIHPSQINDSTKIVMQEDYDAILYSGLNYWEGKIYFATNDGIVNCIDSTGRFLWDYDSNGDVYSKPVIADRILACITYQGDLSTISAVSGEPIQSIGFDDLIVSDLTIINYTGNKELMMPKLTKSKSALVFGTFSGKLHCYDLETLQEYWTNTSAKGAIVSEPVEINNKIYLVSRDGFLYCVDSRDGLLIWRWKPTREIDVIDQDIVTNGKNIFVATSDGTVYSIDMLLGKYDWKKVNLKAVASIGISQDKRRLFVKSESDKIFILSSEKGSMLKEIKFDEGFGNYPSPILEREGKLLVASKGTIYTIDENYKKERIISVDDSPINELMQLDENKFLTSDIDCDIVIFKLN